jgi:hypothetical protein
MGAFVCGTVSSSTDSSNASHSLITTMEIIKWLYLNIRSSAEPADWKFFDTWVLREGEDAEGRPHNTFLIPWKPEEVRRDDYPESQLDLIVVSILVHTRRACRLQRSSYRRHGRDPLEQD